MRCLSESLFSFSNSISFHVTVSRAIAFATVWILFCIVRRSTIEINLFRSIPNGGNFPIVNKHMGGFRMRKEL